MVDVTVTYLEMDERPAYGRPPQPLGPPAALLHAQDPPNWYFLALYDAVGAAYDWTDMHELGADDLAAFVRHPDVTLYTLMRNGWPVGFFMFDQREKSRIDLAYFGMVPQVIGLGLGKYLLHTAVHMAWDLGPEILSVNTCSLDHPRALQLYQSAGFRPVRQEHIIRKGP